MAFKIYYDRRKKQWHNGKGTYYPLGEKSQFWINGQLVQFNSDGTRTVLSKPQPDIYKELWKTENPDSVNYRNGRWYKYKDPKGWYIGPGFDYKQHGSPQFRNKVENNVGVTDAELNTELDNYKQEVISDVDSSLRRYTNYPDTISPQIKMGLVDVYWQSGKGGFTNWERNQRLQQAVANGNLPAIKENGVTFVKGKLDTRRNNERVEKFWHYKQGGNIMKTKLIPRKQLGGFIPKFQNPWRSVSRKYYESRAYGDDFFNNKKGYNSEYTKGNYRYRAVVNGDKVDIYRAPKMPKNSYVKDGQVYQRSRNIGGVSERSIGSVKDYQLYTPSAPSTSQSTTTGNAAQAASAPKSSGTSSGTPQNGRNRGQGRGQGRGNTAAKPAAPTGIASPTEIIDQTHLDARNAAMQKGWRDYFYGGKRYIFTDAEDLKNARANWNNRHNSNYQAVGIMQTPQQQPAASETPTTVNNPIVKSVANNPQLFAPAIKAANTNYRPTEQLRTAESYQPQWMNDMNDWLLKNNRFARKNNTPSYK